MNWNVDFETIKKRQSAYWQREITDRCCISVPVVKDKTFDSKACLEYGETMEDFYYNPSTIDRIQRKSFDNFHFGGDSFPNYLSYFGTAAHSLYFGGSYEINNTIWLDKWIADWEEENVLFNPASPHLERQLSVVKELVQLSKGDYLIGPTDNCGVIDAIVNMRGGMDLLYDLHDFPEEIKTASRHIYDALTETSELFFETIRENNQGGSIHSWMDLWAPGRLQQLQCDFSVMISPEMFEEFVLDEIQRTSKWLDYSVYHLDGQEQIRHLEMLLSVKELNAIQWGPVAGQPCTTEFIPVLKKIQNAGKNLVLMPSKHEVEKLMTELSSKGLHLLVCDAQTVEESEEVMKLAKKLTHE